MDGKSRNLCGLGFDGATYDPSHPDKTRCIGGGTPAAGKGILACAEHSPVLNPSVCQAGWEKQNLPGVGLVCRPTKQQMQCPPGLQISGIDNTCHALCLGGTAWPGTQCCAPGSPITPTGQCCPVGATVDPRTGACGRKISACPPGSKAEHGSYTGAGSGGGTAIVVSGAVAAETMTTLIPLGEHALRGIAAPCAIFTLPED